jgi:nucleotide-binding universal stress UspA family protein
LLHPTDFSSCSDEALAYALGLARASDTTIDVLHVLTLYEPGYDEGIDDTPAAEALRAKLKARVHERLDELVASEGDDVRLHPVVEQGLSAAPAICAFAETHGTEVIVMGTHGRTGLRHFVLGSVAEQVVRHAPCSVLTIREGAAASHRALQRILVPFDFSDHARHALALAKTYAARHEAQLDVLYVIEPLSTPTTLAGALTLSDLVPDIRNTALQNLKQAYDAIEGPTVVAKFHVTEGHAASVITDCAESLGSDLVCIATHGLSNAQRFFLGSVAERVVRRSSCPVYVVRTRPTPMPGHEATASDQVQAQTMP